jgi:hypothetical protein
MPTGQPIARSIVGDAGAEDADEHHQADRSLLQGAMMSST